MNDALLREAFEQLRREDERHVPSVEAVLRRRPRARLAARLAAAFVCVLTFASTVAVLHRAGERSPAESYAFPRWSAPTDVLLNTPGLELTHDVPNLQMKGVAP